MLKTIAACIALIGLSACTWFGTHDNSEPAPTAYQSIDFAGEKATAEERALCDAAGGEVHRDGLAGFERCTQTYGDAGKSCTDSSDCEGRCEVSGEFSDMGKRGVTGRCQATDSPFGCFQIVENGQATAALCVD